MELYGIIGKPLGHSFSRDYFTERFRQIGRDAAYVPFPLESIEEFPSLVCSHPELVGLNVTLPYKQLVIPYLDALSAEAAAIGAVNVIQIDRDGSRMRLTGHNTDVIGFSRSITPMLCIGHTRALVLGTGGASQAVRYALRKLGIQATLVSRSPAEGQLGYGDLSEDIMHIHTVIVNATPLGTYPATHGCPDIPFQWIGTGHLCFDLVYNPAKTLFLQRAEAQGATIQNGLEMLHIQADEAWKIWNKE